MITTCVAPLENTSMLLKECNENDAAERVEVLDPDRKIFHLLFERLPSLSIMRARIRGFIKPLNTIESRDVQRVSWGT